MFGSTATVQNVRLPMLLCTAIVLGALVGGPVLLGRSTGGLDAASDAVDTRDRADRFAPPPDGFVHRPQAAADPGADVAAPSAPTTVLLPPTIPVESVTRASLTPLAPELVDGRWRVVVRGSLDAADGRAFEGQVRMIVRSVTAVTTGSAVADRAVTTTVQSDGTFEIASPWVPAVGASAVSSVVIAPDAYRVPGGRYEGIGGDPITVVAPGLEPDVPEVLGVTQENPKAADAGP